MKRLPMKKLMTGVSTIAFVTAIGASAMAQNDVIIVTATKRAENAQDIPVAIQALGEETLDQNGIETFNDYIEQLPGVNSGGTGPGQGTIYIRGLASTTPNLTTSNAAGLTPNVALYLDEQPVTQVGRNLDVYAADLNRIEVLKGPQGTLFGASAQAGAVRLITNKPNFDGFSAKLSTGVSFTAHGDRSEKVEVMVNIPVSDSLAVRGVVFVDNQGGFIDNVPGTVSAADAVRFSPGVIRPNGQPGTVGFQGSSDVSGVTFLELNNQLAGLVEDNFNDARYSGFRVSALYEISDDWSFTLQHMRQRTEFDGAFVTDPTLADPDGLSIQRYAPEHSDDRFGNTAWTLEGRLGMLDMVYTGAYNDRETKQIIDYTDYMFSGQYLPYYICDASVTYPSVSSIPGTPLGTCQAPLQFVDSTTLVETLTQELRFTTPADKPIRATVGGFYSNQEVIERNDFTYPGSQAIALTDGGPPVGFPQNGSLPGSSVSLPGLRPPGVIFHNDITRTDKQYGIFGEISVDLVPDRLTVTGGTRWYDVDVSLRGSANSSFGNFFAQSDVQSFGSNLDTLFDGTQVINGVAVPMSAAIDGFVFKGNVSWTPTDNSLFYFTYSEGFRPPLPNRPAGAGGGIVPAIVDSDEVTNYEIGWKLDLFENQLRFNGAAFYVDISGLQTTIFDTSVTNLLFSDNAADGEIKGVEGEIIWSPIAAEGLTVNGAFSILDTEITGLPGASQAIAEGGNLSQAPSFQANMRARYEWDVNSNVQAHIMPSISYSASSFSDIVLSNRGVQDSYFLMGFSAGIHKDNWMLEVYGSNLTDERAQLNNDLRFERERISVNRPRTLGVRLSVDFQ